MEKQLREGFKRLLDSLPEGATAGSYNWTDNEMNYSASVSSQAPGNWQGWASAYPVPNPVEVCSVVTMEAASDGALEAELPAPTRHKKY